jgi:hypothetical protein
MSYEEIEDEEGAGMGSVMRMKGSREAFQEFGMPLQTLIIFVPSSSSSGHPVMRLCRVLSRSRA